MFAPGHDAALRDLAATSSLDEQIVDLSPDHISVVGPDYRYRRVNRAYERAHGLAREDILGCHVAYLLGQTTFDCRVRPLLDKCLHGEDVRYEAWFDFPAAGRRFMGVSYTPLVDPAGRVDGVLVVSRDLTDREAARQEVRRRDALLELLADNLPGVFWVCAPEDPGALYVSPGYETIWGRPRAELYQSRRAMLQGVHPEDRERVACLRDSPDRPWDTEYRARRPDGQQRWVRDQGLPVHDEPSGRKLLIGVITDISERKKVEHDLTAARRQAEIASRTRGAFLAAMSHELRTPLNAVIGFSEVMRAEMFGPLGSPEYADYVDDIHQSGRHLLGLVEDVLEMSFLDSDAPMPAEAPADPAAVVGSCLRLVRGRAAERGVELVADLPAEAPRLRGDARRLKQLLFALVSNAVKFTEAGGRVVVALDREADGGVVLRVSDTGIGMTPEAIAAAMQPLERPRGPDSAGPGLDLPLADHLARAHGGRLDIDSSPGQGTTVRVRLPAARVVD